MLFYLFGNKNNLSKVLTQLPDFHLEIFVLCSEILCTNSSFFLNDAWNGVKLDEEFLLPLYVFVTYFFSSNQVAFTLFKNQFSKEILIGFL